MPRWLKFTVVGGVGFFVDAAILYVCVHVVGFGPIGSRIASFSIALLVTWFFNRTFTFESAGRFSRKHELFLYAVASVVGFTVNFSFYALLVILFSTMSEYPLLALVPSSIVAAFVNYFGVKKIVFRAS
ncbi:GtrA family protein [Aestuariirhabdus haliotis]|uniref:GtrA family protein n=1 Tax=Aestuariirhabdus haliotis TaxID=2918751 RepID=UPI00387308E8